MKEIKQELVALIEEERWKRLKIKVENLTPIEVAQLIEEVSDRDKIIIFRLLDHQQTKDVFKILSHEKQNEIIVGLAVNANKISRLLNDLEHDDRTAFLGELPDEVAHMLIKQLSHD